MMRVASTDWNLCLGAVCQAADTKPHAANSNRVFKVKQAQKTAITDERESRVGCLFRHTRAGLLSASESVHAKSELV